MQINTSNINNKIEGENANCKFLKSFSRERLCMVHFRAHWSYHENELRGISRLVN